MNSNQSQSKDDPIQFSFIDTVRKKRIEVNLKNSGGGILPFKDTIEKLCDVTTDKVNSKESNNYRDQIHPLCTFATMTILKKLLGSGTTAILAGSVEICSAIQLVATSMFTMGLWLQEKGIKTIINEESLTDLEIEEYITTSQTSSMMLYAASMGLDLDETAAYLLSKGKVTEDSLVKLGFNMDKVRSFLNKENSETSKSN